MNTTSKIHTFAILGAVLALALMPILVDSAYADTNDELATKIQKLQEKITSIQERDETIDFAEKKLISKYQQKIIQYKAILEKDEQKEASQKFMKSEVQRLNAEEAFQQIHRDIYVEKDQDRGIFTDDTLLDALEAVVEKEDYALVSAGLDKMINQYRDVEVRNQLQEYKGLVMDAMHELNEVDNKNTEVLALTTDDIKLPTSEEFGEKNEIFNPEIIKTQLKQQIKTAVQSTKILADKISEETQQKYQSSNKIANLLDDKKPLVIDEFSKPKYQTKGVLSALDKLTSANEKAKNALNKVKDAKNNVNSAQKALNSAQAAVDGSDPDSKEYKDAAKALKKAQKNLTKAQNAANKAQTSADKASANVISAEGKYYKLEGACLQAPPIRKPHPPTYMASGGKRTLELTGKLGDGWLPIGYTPELFEDHRKQIEVSMDKHGRTQEEKDNFQMALDIDVYFSEDAEESWAKMKEAVKVSLFKPEVLRVHQLKEIEGFDFVKYFTDLLNF